MRTALEFHRLFFPFRCRAWVLVLVAIAPAACATQRPSPPPNPTPTPQTATRSEPDATLEMSDKENTTKQPRIPVYQRGKASYYGAAFQGRETASGELFDAGKLTAAHRRLPLGTRVRVTNAENGRSVVVRINDRGPYADGRILDLSQRAAKRLGMIKDGTTEVKLQIVKDR